ncbi:MAG: hypothetical protein M1817_001306 [Caeruleum heppii]|nr:MAG: hypothetical protein M1817_001306 [Caeruleum heppii]
MSLTFPVLSEAARRQLKHEALLPVILSAVLFSSEGFESGYFLGASDADVVQDSENRFTWSARSMTFLRLKQMTTGLLFGAMGSVSRLVAYLVEDAADPYVVELTMDHLSTFCRTVVLQWRRTKLSEIDPSEEGLYLSQEALNITLPVLWQTLKAIMFSTIVILQAVTARALKDAALSNDRAPPVIAKQILIILHDLAFISYRLGSNAFSAYNFVFLTALDVLSRYADESTALLVAIRPQQLGRISAHPLDRCLDLYFLNASEHLTLVTPQSMSEELLVAAATPYLTSTGNINLVETFEAAHSLMLAILSAPQNAELSRRVIPFYVEALFEV